jgi:tetratricopeptide (TPR) repeat protein
MRARLLIAGLLIASCHTPSTKEIVNQPPTEAPVPREHTALFPSKPKVFGPSFVSFAKEPMKGEDNFDIEECGRCHQEVSAMWKASAHSWASFDNPIYRMSIERLRREVGNTESRFCGGCHDIALLLDNAMDVEIKPEDKRAHAGITCKTCHSIASATLDGNGSFALTNEEIPIPTNGDPESIKAHVARVAPPALRSVEMCASCHRAFLGPETGNAHHLPGMDDYTPWSRSIFAGSYGGQMDFELEQKNCRDCHMPMEPATKDAAATNGKVASHRFLGGHTWLASMRNDADTLKRVQEFLQNVVSVDIPVAIASNGERFFPAESIKVEGGQSLIFDVVIRNHLVGHRFPGGTLDAHDTWLEVSAFDKSGKLIAQAGAEHESKMDDPETHVLRAYMLGEGGVPLLTRETHKFRAVVYNSTIAPRETAVVQYQIEIPKDFSPEDLPLKVVATLKHRSRNLALQKETCEDLKAERAALFAKYTLEYRGETLDPCAPQPVTVMSSKEILVGKDFDKTLDWERLYAHGLGVTRALQERVGEARPSLELALSVLKPEQKKERSMVLAALANVAVRQGRLDEALSWVEKASQETPQHPALAMIRGDAYAQVWRWKQSIVPYQSATKATPNDPMAWVKLAIAAGSADMPEEALSAAKSGLLLEPRNADLLRVQALALQSLGSPLSEEALQQFLEFRPLDTAPGIRGACSMKVDNCALERSPVHAHEMK